MTLLRAIFSLGPESPVRCSRLARLATAALCAAPLWLAPGCGDDGSAATGTSQTVDVDASGGSVTAEGATVAIPAGALTSAVGVTIMPTTDPVAELPVGLPATGEVFAFLPHGTTFSSPVTVTLPYDPDSGADAVLRLANESDTSWDIVDDATFVNGVASSPGLLGTNQSQGVQRGRSDRRRGQGASHPWRGPVTSR